MERKFYLLRKVSLFSIAALLALSLAALLRVSVAAEVLPEGWVRGWDHPDIYYDPNVVYSDTGIDARSGVAYTMWIQHQGNFVSDAGAGVFWHGLRYRYESKNTMGTIYDLQLTCLITPEDQDAFIYEWSLPAPTNTGESYINLYGGESGSFAGSYNCIVWVEAISNSNYHNSFTLRQFCDVFSGECGISNTTVLYSLTAPTLPGGYCLDGTELLTEPVLLSRELGNSWSWTGNLDYENFALRYRLENPTPEGTTIYAIATVNENTYLIKPPIGTELIESTIPETGALAGPGLDTILLNGYDTFKLTSVCAVEAVPKPRYGDCTQFYDFTSGIEPWEKIPGTGANWAEDEENGALRIISDGSGGDAVALVPIPAGTWEMRFSARSYAESSAITFGLVGASFPYTDTVSTATLDGAYQQLSASGIVSGYAKIQGQAVMVDWVCLYNANAEDAIGGPLLPIPVCGVFPGFDDHPDFEITQIGNWIYWMVQKVGEILTWLICKIVEAVNSAINWLVTQIYRIMGNLDLPTMPDFPENLFDIRGWLEWYRQSYNAILQWFWRNWRNGLQSIKNILLWVWQFWTGGLEFIGSLWLRGVELLLEHVLALFGIAADIDLMGLFRDGRIFLQNIRYEVQLEFESLLTLLDETAEVLEVLFIGWSGALAGDVQADFGENMGGLGAFIWKGVDWVGEAIDGTPLTALNIISLGVLAWGLITYTLETISRILEKLFTLG